MINAGDRMRPLHGDLTMEFQIFHVPVQWPSYSPDLNPIENLFSVLAQRVRDRNPEGVDELREFLLDEWDRVEQEELAQLAYSMPHRCDAVIDSEGHKIND